MKCFLIDKTRWTFTFEAPIKSFDFRCTESEKIIECQLLVSCNKLWRQFYPVASHNPAIVFGLYRWGNSRSKTGGSATFKDYSTILTKCTCILTIALDHFCGCCLKKSPYSVQKWFSRLLSSITFLLKCLEIQVNVVTRIAVCQRNKWFLCKYIKIQF